MGGEAAYIIGAFSTVFGHHADLSFRDLTKAAFNGALSDAALADDHRVDSVWFGCTGTGGWPRAVNIGQMCLYPLLGSRQLPGHTPIYNVENACATGSQAFQGAVKDILSGHAELSMALGVEKIFNPNLDRAGILKSFSGDAPGSGDVHDAFHAENTAAYDDAKKRFPLSGPEDDRKSVFMDTYAVQARAHMSLFGTTQRQLAASAAKNHRYGCLNDRAQYRFDMSVEDVLADRVVSHPLTRAMCAPISDGAAAVLVCSESYLGSLGATARERAIRVAAIAFTSGTFRKPEEPGLSRDAASRAYADAGIRPEEVDVAEIHDATAFGEIFQSEMLGFCPTGEGGPFVESGATGPGGSVPINTSGGLVSKGHPIAATGLSMLFELARQLRGEAGERQVPDASIALQENGGGVMGLEEAACSVCILTRR